ncbi:DNA cytosine methyltransferase [Actinomyces qiguomingii]|uniref:DNA cytosine methyltransferase n=1 Tax=Actinomyces qiguomingii TaxID=2057800 RepID=UPI000CA02FDF|nr:DNA cytosine methyltransferase [Actinomyces qiguomingii]
MGSTTIRVLDLFAGAGGLTAGFHEASDRFQSVAAVEMDPYAAASYHETFPDTDVYAGSIQHWLAEDAVPSGIDVVVGGPPCQGFSTLGKQDAEDERNRLWEQYAQVIRRAEPKFFVVENVPAFGKSPQYRDFLDATSPGGFLEDYSFDFRVLNAADYGAPQTRKRAVLIGHHRDMSAPGFPEPTHSPNGDNDLKPYETVRDALRGVPAKPDMDARFDEVRTQVGSREVPGAFSPRELHISRNYSDQSRERFENIPEGGNRSNLPDHLKAPCWLRHTTGSMDVMGRLHWDRPSVTIRTEFFKPEKGRYLHPVEHRAITHYEAALLQGFPETHRFIGSRTAIARQIGNAVPIPLGAAIARRILKEF